MKADDPVTGNKHLTKSDSPVSDDNGVGSSKAGPSKENSLEDKLRSRGKLLSMKELRNVRKVYSCCENETPPGESIPDSDTGILGLIP